MTDRKIEQDHHRLPDIHILKFGESEAGSESCHSIEIAYSEPQESKEEEAKILIQS